MKKIIGSALILLSTCALGSEDVGTSREPFRHL